MRTRMRDNEIGKRRERQRKKDLNALYSINLSSWFKYV